MSKILILCYDYPPRNSIGAQRPAAWYKYLVKLGHEVKVIAGPWSENGPDQNIIYINEKRSFRKRYLQSDFIILAAIRKIISFTRLVFSFQLSLFDDKNEIYHMARMQCKTFEPDFIITSAEPFILFNYGSRLAKEFNVKWVADYRDPWSSERSVRNKSKLFTLLNDTYFRYLEKKILIHADIITTASEPYKNLIEKVVKNKNIEIIPNGFDIPENYQRRNPGKEVLEFMYLGRLYPHRNFKLFFSAIIDFIIERNIDFIRITFFGLASFPEQRKMVEAFTSEIHKYISFKEMVPYENIMDSAQRAHIGLMFSDGKSNFSPAKLYDYVGLNRKIWLSPQDGGTLSKLIRKYNLGLICNSKAELTSALTSACEAFKNSNVDYFKISSVEEFSRSSSVEKLHHLLNNHS